MLQYVTASTQVCTVQLLYQSTIAFSRVVNGERNEGAHVVQFTLPGNGYLT